ncbi:MAG: alpha/beta fold hydrolase [Clostridia bacterium]|nr:alpha/beta fold hydrolase [Clostridia bacterium]
MENKTGFINTPEGKIFCEIIGMGKPGIPLLLINGGPGGNRKMLRETICEMVTDRPVISYTQMNTPGSRPNSRTDSSYWTLEYYTEEIERVRKAFGTEKIIIFGHSWGGGLALNYAVSHPGSCAGIIAGSPLIRASDWQRDTSKRIEEIRPEVKDFINGVIKNIPQLTPDMISGIEAKAEEALFMSRFQDSRYAPTLYLRYLLGQRKDSDIPEGKEVYMHMWGQNEYRITGTLKDMDISGLLPSISVPVLFVCGQYDEILPETVRGYSKMVQNGDFHIVKDATHTFMCGMDCEESSRLYIQINSLIKKTEKQHTYITEEEQTANIL